MSEVHCGSAVRFGRILRTTFVLRTTCMFSAVIGVLAVWRHNKPKTKNLLGKLSCRKLHRHLITAHHSDRKNSPSPGGFAIYYVPSSRTRRKRTLLEVFSTNKKPPRGGFGGGGFFWSTRMRSQLLGGLAVWQFHKQTIKQTNWVPITCLVQWLCCVFATQKKKKERNVLFRFRVFRF